MRKNNKLEERGGCGIFFCQSCNMLAADVHHKILNGNLINHAEV